MRMLIRVILIVLISGGEVRADGITLRDGAGVGEVGVRLADVAELEGERAELLGDVAVGEFSGGSGTLVITRSEIQRVLDAHGVNWGFVTLRGPERITVERWVSVDVAAANPLAAVDAGESGAVVVRGRGLKELVSEWVVSSCGRAAEELRIELINEGDARWGMNEGDGRIELEADAARLVGRVPFTVRQYRGGELIATERVAVDVSVRREVVTAVTTIHRGQTVTEADLRGGVQWLDSGRVEPVGDAAGLVGLTATRVIREGEVIEAGDVGPRAMVKRGDLVTVRVLSGGVVVKMTARAMEDGQGGQTIEVRHLREREVYRVQVTGPREAVMLIDGAGIEAAGEENRNAGES